MLFKKIIAVYSEKHTKPTEYKMQLLTVKVGGIYNHH
jgi:hypothetical protein